MLGNNISKDFTEDYTLNGGERAQNNANPSSGDQKKGGQVNDNPSGSKVNNSTQNNIKDFYGLKKIGSQNPLSIKDHQKVSKLTSNSMQPHRSEKQNSIERQPVNPGMMNSAKSIETLSDTIKEGGEASLTPRDNNPTQEPPIQ